MGLGLDEISQSVIDDGYSCDYPFSDVGDDVDGEADKQHLQAISSVLQSKAETQYHYGKDDACQDVKEDSGEADDKQSHPLNKG